MDLSALQKISYGLYVVSSMNREGRKNGLIVNTVFQVTAVPPTIAVSVCKKNLTCEYIQESGYFTVSILETSAKMRFIGLFGFHCGRDIDKFESTNFIKGKSGCPVVLEHTIAYLEAKVINTMDAGTHIVFQGEVTDAQMVHETARPMTYNYYHEVKKGTAPENAPTYVSEKEKNNKKQEESTMKKYRCVVCGYIYDPGVGDPDAGIKAGTAFEDLPDDWVCPLCGVGKDDFEPAE